MCELVQVHLKAIGTYNHYIKLVKVSLLKKINQQKTFRNWKQIIYFIEYSEK